MSIEHPWEDAAKVISNLDAETLTVDQLLKFAEVNALLAIGQELSLIQDAGINPEWRSRRH